MGSKSVPHLDRQSLGGVVKRNATEFPILQEVSGSWPLHWKGVAANKRDRGKFVVRNHSSTPLSRAIVRNRSRSLTVPTRTMLNKCRDCLTIGGSKATCHSVCPNT